MKKSASQLPITLILLGDIAAGKGTQSKLLLRRFRLKYIETGGYTRKLWTGTSKVSRQLARSKWGKLAPSDIIQRYLKSSLEKLKKNEGVLVDGGKMPAEARLIHRILRAQDRKILVIYLTIPHAEIYRRLTRRYYCERSGKIITLARVQKRCPHCAGPLIKRADDEPEAVRNRIRYYDEVYSKTVKFWQGKKMLRKINGRQSVHAVTKAILKTIKEYYKNT